MNKICKQDIIPIMSALFYLSKEAKNSGLDVISSCIEQSIKKIEEHILNQEQNPAEIFATSEMLSIMNFFYAYSSSSKEARDRFLEEVSQ